MEPGDSGSVFGDSNFWDYVIVEATMDGFNWIPLSDGYDSRFDQAWSTDFNTNDSPDSTLFRTHSLNLTNKFKPGEKILIRFRFFADEYVNGWGWAIDNVNIQPSVLSVKDNSRIPNRFMLYQNYPNPFNPTTIIKYSIPSSPLPFGKGLGVRLVVYDILGKEVATLVNENQQPGNYEVTFNALSNEGINLASGVYFYRLQAGKFSETKKLILLK